MSRSSGRTTLPQPALQALQVLIEEAARAGMPISAAAAVEQILKELPAGSASPAELAEALLRAAAERGVPVAVTRHG